MKKNNNNVYTSQIYDDSLLFLEEEETNCQYDYEILDYWKNKYCLVKGYDCSVFANKNRIDYTNDRISNINDKLILIGENVPKKDEAEDIHKTVLLRNNNNFKYCIPMVYPRKQYMNGGNYLKCPLEINEYPIAIYDYEENDKNEKNNQCICQEDRSTNYKLLYNQLLTIIQEQQKFIVNSHKFLDFEGIINYIEYQLDIAELNGIFSYPVDLEK